MNAMGTARRAVNFWLAILLVLPTTHFCLCCGEQAPAATPAEAVGCCDFGEETGQVPAPSQGDGCCCLNRASQPPRPQQMVLFGSSPATGFVVVIARQVTSLLDLWSDRASVPLDVTSVGRVDDDLHLRNGILLV